MIQSLKIKKNTTAWPLVPPGILSNHTTFIYKKTSVSLLQKLAPIFGLIRPNTYVNEAKLN